MDNISVLKNLGFSEYESKAYLALAEDGPLTAKEIAAKSNIPKNKVYDTLEKLEKKKIITLLPIVPKTFRIIDVNQLKELIDNQKNTLKNLEISVDEIISNAAMPKIKEVKEPFWIIKGKQAIIKKMEFMNAKAKREILSINRLSSTNIKNLKSMRHATENKVVVKMLVPYNKSVEKNIERWKSIGVEIRNYDESKHGFIGTRFSVFDKKIVRLTLGEPDAATTEDYITLWAESQYFANMMREYFYNIWKKSDRI